MIDSADEREEQASYRADSVDDVLGRKLISLCDLSIPSATALQLGTLHAEVWTSSGMDGAVHPCSSQLRVDQVIRR